MAGPRVLLIEDSPTYAELATIMLSKCGCTVMVATTAADGLLQAHAQRPDLIIVDINLPGMDGLHAARLLRDSWRTGRVALLALTAADVSPDDEQVAREAGFDAFITKPFDEGEFRRTLAPFLPTPEG